MAGVGSASPKISNLSAGSARCRSSSQLSVRAAGTGDYDKLRDTIENDTRFKLAAIPESVYFLNQSRSSIFLKGAGTLIAVLLTFGAMFSAANTMFAGTKWRAMKRRIASRVIRRTLVIVPQTGWPSVPPKKRAHDCSCT